MCSFLFKVIRRRKNAHWSLLTVQKWQVLFILINSTFLFLNFCDSQSEAEEICSILDQIFQLVYTEATMAHLDNAIGAGEEGIHLMPCT